MDNSTPNALEDSNEFEFAALNEALNYRNAIFEFFAPKLKGDVLEAGAGIGQLSQTLAESSSINSLTCIEPEAEFCRRHRDTIRDDKVSLFEGVTQQLDPNRRFDAILSVNVLEHIEADGEELAHFADRLRERRGALCLLVPARPEIYAPLDKDFGHYRRYLKTELGQKLERAGFRIEQLHYWNFVGYFAWLWTYRICKSRTFDPTKVRLFDRLIFPPVKLIEQWICRPPIGQSLVAIAIPK